MQQRNEIKEKMQASTRVVWWSAFSIITILAVTSIMMIMVTKRMQVASSSGTTGETSSMQDEEVEVGNGKLQVDGK